VFSPVIFFADFIQILAFVLTAAILVRIVLSWFSIGGAAPFVRLLFEITEPILAPIRRVIPTAGMFDFSPIVALLLISIVSNVLLGSLPR